MSVQRIRGATLQRRRKLWFTLHPLCVACQKKGVTSMATELDHVVPLFKGGADDQSNLQGLCPTCHEQKTADDLGYVKRHAIGLDGWPIPEGVPEGRRGYERSKKKG